YLGSFLVVAVAFFAGVRLLVRRRQALPVTAALVVIAALTAYFRLLARDPWTGEAGHSWNLFKLCQWAFPLVTALEIVGLWVLWRRLGWPSAMRVSCLLLGLLYVPAAVNHARSVITSSGLAGARYSLPEMVRLRQRVAELD